MVFMADWQISGSSKGTILLGELRTLVLFEFIPKEEIKKYLYAIVGVKVEDGGTGSTAS